jgi:hypothetical protein
LALNEFYDKDLSGSSANRSYTRPVAFLVAVRFEISCASVQPAATSESVTT